MPTVSIRIVADYVALFCQVTREFRRATTLAITTVSAIIFIHCCVVVIILLQNEFSHYYLSLLALLILFLESISDILFLYNLLLCHIFVF